MSEPRSARVRVPATSANLGAGFDCVGMAVERWLTASVTIRDDPRGATSDDAAIGIRRGGTLASLDVAPAEDAIVRGFTAACAACAGAVPTRMEFLVDSEIPIARGLGSSSAALVAGARLANMTLELGLSLAAIATLCADLEGHPDNVAPAVFGGLVLAVPDGSQSPRWVFAQLAAHDDIAFVFIVPPFLVETARARAALPREVTHSIATRAAGKAAALVQGLATGNAALLRTALDDVLHVPYRHALVPGLTSVHDAARDAGAFGLTLSGSGSTLVAISPQGSADRVANAMQRAWRALGIAAETFVQRRPAVAETTEKRTGACASAALPPS